MTPYEKHKARWNRCTGCSLCKKRNRVVLARGKLPCDVLFVGEAPGASEDVLGKPFVGPAGRLLDRIIVEALNPPLYDEAADPDWTPPPIAFTNLVACIPKEEGNEKREPTKEAIDACLPRLVEFFHLSLPTILIRVGQLAMKYATFSRLKAEDGSGKLIIADILHPAAILRLDVSQKGLAIQRCVATLADVFASIH